LFFRTRPFLTIGIFTVLAFLPFFIDSLCNEHLFIILFDRLGFFDIISPIPLFLATGNFLVLRRKSGSRAIPTLAAIVIGWALLTETHWGMDFTALRNSGLIRYAGFMPYVSWINDLTLYIGAAYLLTTPLIQQIDSFRNTLKKKGFPFPSGEMY